MRYNADDRGQRYCDIFPEIGKGDINVTIIEPHSGALWHRHQHQSDWQFVVKGSLKIGVCNLPRTINEQMKKEWNLNYKHLYQKSVKHYQNVSLGKLTNKKIATVSGDEPECNWHYMSERNANEGALFIPSGLWHGCYNYTNEPAVLIYHITNKWDGSDEERCDIETMGWDYEKVIK